MQFVLRLVRWPGIERVRDNLKDPTPIMESLGAFVKAGSAQRFDDQGDPPLSWPERMTPNIPGVIADMNRSPNIKARRFQGRPAAIDTNRMAASVDYVVVSPEMVLIGSNLEYAGTQFHGGESQTEAITEKGQGNLWTFLRSGRGSAHRSDLGFLLNRKMTGQRIDVEIQSREFIGMNEREREEAVELITEGLLE